MSDDEFGAFFEEPEDFRPPAPEPHQTLYQRKLDGVSPKEIKLRLVGSLPLWGHMLWNAGIYTADFLDKHSQDLVNGKRVLEVGAAAGLPSLICSLNDAAKVVCTDYPDADLITNIQTNFDMLKEEASLAPHLVTGYIWGQDLRPLVGRDTTDDKPELTDAEKFDLCILSDVVFNHNQHHALLETCRKALKSTGRALVVFSPHRPWLLEDDLQFFTTCEEHQLKAEKIEMVNWKPMFDEDPETVEIRLRIYAYYLVPQWD